jgi:uncharacterized metal-binding protein
MPELPKKKVGIVSCSGEELAEGTITRLATRKVLDQLRPEDTVTICLPLFLAGGEGDRAFAKFYPTIAVDGCELRCAARGTEKYSSKPAASIMVRDILIENGIGKPVGRRHLNEGGVQAVDATAEKIAAIVDELLGKHWNRTAGTFEDPVVAVPEPKKGDDTEKIAPCSCGSGIPVQEVQISGKAINLIALPLIFENFRQEGKEPTAIIARELLETARLYNQVLDGADEDYLPAILQEYTKYCEKEAEK